MAPRLPMSFHQKWPLDRSRLVEVLRYAQLIEHVAKGQSIFVVGLKENTTLGANMLEVYPQYCFGVGLLDDSPMRNLTTFGRATIKYDPVLQQSSTQWLMHYHLSAEKGPGPVYWHVFFSKIFQPGLKFNKGDVQEAVRRSEVNGGKKDRSPKTIFKSANALVNTYIQKGGLEQLRLFHDISTDKSRFEAPFFPSQLPYSSFGYALIDHWESVWSGKLTVNLDDLLSPGGLAAILCLDRQTVDTYLAQLQQEGLIDLFRVAPPHQLVRRWSDPADAMQRQLTRMYDIDAR